MGKETKIGWTYGTINLWEGCNKVAATCKNCYAARQSNWLRPNEKLWGLPEHGAYRREVMGWRKTLANISKQANEDNTALPVFVGSMMDIWEDGDTPTDKGRTIGEIRDEFLEIIPRYPHLIFQLLTSRPQNILPILNGRKLPSNVWLGVSIGNQQELDTMGKTLVDVPADTWEDGRHRRFLSIEPMLGPVTLKSADEDGADDRPYWKDEIDWIIIGGESGHNARQMQAQWVYDLIEECGGAVDIVGEGYGIIHDGGHEDGIEPRVFFKQWGEYNEAGQKVGTSKSGREVKGREFNNMPGVMYAFLDELIEEQDEQGNTIPCIYGMDYSLVYAQPWFDLCRSGIKTEEYRNLESRQYKALRALVGKKLHGCQLTGFHGYKADRSSFTCELLAVTIGTGDTEWGAVEGLEYLVLHLGKVLSGKMLEVDKL